MCISSLTETDKIMANQGLKQGCPLRVVYPLFVKDLGKFLNTSDGAMTASQTTKAFHSENADDIALTTNTAHHLLLQLDRLRTHATMKGLMLTAHKTKIMVFFCSNPPIFCYNGTPLENVQEFKCLGMTLRHNGRMTCLIPDGMQFCWHHSQSKEDLFRVGHQEQEACHVLDFCTSCRPTWMSTFG